jgi:hypothetical protein
MLFYPAALPLSRQTLDYTAGIIRRHRRQIGSPWRKLAPGRQALLVLAYLRKGETFAELAAGRYVTEAVALLAARSPKLRWALTRPGTPARQPHPAGRCLGIHQPPHRASRPRSERRRRPA